MSGRPRLVFSLVAPTALAVLLLGACNGGKLVVLGAGQGAGGNTTTTSNGAGNGGACAGDLRVCGEACVDIRYDPDHCGDCGKACDDGQVCSEGVCGLACGVGMVTCADSGGAALCVDTQTNAAHCGSCGNACAAGKSCVGGACVVGCGGGAVLCGETCTQTSFDPLHCGGCGMACPVAVNTVAVCADGTCGLQCKSGYGDCNQQVLDGCETNVGVAPQHCGACGKPCAVQNGTPGCDGGMCKVASCNSGFGNCDNDAASCETDLLSSAQHCGMCNKACDAGFSCINGVCSSLPPTCRLVGGLKWCVNVNFTGGLNCNVTCASVGMTPIDDNNVWFEAQNTVAECQAIRNAFGIATPISIAGYTYGCAEAKPQEFICSNSTGCPQNHRTGSDGSDHIGVCPCK